MNAKQLKTHIKGLATKAGVRIYALDVDRESAFFNVHVDDCTKLANVLETDEVLKDLDQEYFRQPDTDMTNVQIWRDC